MEAGGYQRAESYMQKRRRYCALSETKNIIGYVVNVHSPLNLDIDLDLSPAMRSRYRDVIITEYTYRDDRDKEHTGFAYRCRLRGVNGRPANTRSEALLVREAKIELIRAIDQSNGWVVCSISDIDVYRRLLVHIADPITKRDLGEMLFSPRFGGFFTRYDNDRAAEPATQHGGAGGGVQAAPHD